MNVETGIPAIGKVEWGSHFCHFYRTAEDLEETLLPFFRIGVEQNEACLWVTAEPFGKERAHSALGTAIQNLDQRINSGQIAIYDQTEWYELHGSKSRADVARVWLDAKAKATERGFRGLRLTGNAAFLEREDWDSFMDYEHVVSEAFRRQEIIALCSYSSDKCDADAVLDVVQAHDFALARRRGAWEVIESASVKKSKEALAALNAELERRIAERTRELTDALGHQRLLTAELSHRVKNTMASVQTLVEQTLRTQHSLEEASAAVRGRLSALAHAHDRLAAVDWNGVSLGELLVMISGPYRERVRLELNGEVLTPRAALDLSLIVHELLANALKHGALQSDKGVVTVRARREGASFVICWQESGGPAVARPSREGFGSQLIRQLVAHDLRGECELAFDRSGLMCTVCAPAGEMLVRKSGCAHGGDH